jgi:2'-5' RNA ligase
MSGDATSGDATSAAGAAAGRWFYAALPDPAVRLQIGAAAAALPLPAGGAAVPADTHHMTLAFVGAVPAAGVAMLKAIGGAQRSPRFTLRFDAYEYWPKPEVVVAAARVVPPALEQFWLRLHAELAVHGWALAPKRLRPHITLARNITQAPVLPAMSAFEWSVGALSLMRSEPGVARPAYTVVDTWPLLDNA